MTNFTNIFHLTDNTKRMLLLTLICFASLC